MRNAFLRAVRFWYSSRLTCCVTLTAVAWVRHSLVRTYFFVGPPHSNPLPPPGNLCVHNVLGSPNIDPPFQRAQIWIGCPFMLLTSSSNSLCFVGEGGGGAPC